MSILGKTTKWVERGINFARNQSLLDAVAKSTKVLEAIELEGKEKKENPVLGTAYQAAPDEAEAPISQRQRDYIIHLLNLRDYEDGERDRIIADLDGMSKVDASDLISSLAETE